MRRLSSGWWRRRGRVLYAGLMTGQSERGVTFPTSEGLGTVDAVGIPDLGLLMWSCMVCGKLRPDAEIAVATATSLGDVVLKVNVRHCRDSDACRVAAEESALADATQFGAPFR